MDPRNEPALHKILVVNDDAPTRYAVSRTLQRSGFTVLEAETGEVALQLLAEHLVDLVVLDIHLPGISGYEVCRTIKKTPATSMLPVLYLTGSSSAGADRFHDLDGGGDCYLTHPVEPAVLIATIRALLRLFRAERSARSAAREWQASFRAIFDAIGILDREGKVVRSNPAFQRLTGRGESELEGVHCGDLFPGTEAVEELFTRTRATRRREEREFAAQDRWFRAALDPLLTDAEEPAGAVLILADITERKRSEAAVVRSEQMFRALFENAMDAIMIADDQGNYVDVNPAACAVLGRDRDELTQLSIWDLVPRENAALARTAWDSFIREGEQSGIFELVGTDGAHRLVDYRARANFRPGLHLSVLRDITERARIEQALQTSEERFRVALQGSNISVFSQDRELRYTWIYNPQPGMTPEEFVGKTDLELASPETAERLVTLKQAVLDSGERQRSEIPVEFGNQRFTFELHVEPLRDPAGEIIGVIGAAADVTVRKRSEEELLTYHRQLRDLSAHLESIREDERARVAQEVHDELGQALTGFKLEIASIVRDLPPRNRTLVPRLRAMADLVDGTIQSVRRISTELRPLILDELGLQPAIEWYAGIFQQRTGIDCRVRPQSPDPALPVAVSVACFRIVQEALTNVARHSEATEVSIDLETGERELRLSIRDNGVGIADERLRDRKSMGLAGMRERASALGGKFTLESGCAEGTAVSVVIPLEGGIER